MSSIAERLQQVRERIDSAARRCQRDPSCIRLVAVSKRQPAEAMREAYALGQRDFGENYVQELESKARELADLPDLRLHLIGHLQRNKVKVVVPLASMIHSVDSVELAREIAKRAVQNAVPAARRFPLVGAGATEKLPILVEVNVGGEAQKSGCEPADLPAVLDAVDAMPQLQLAGLMTVPPFTDTPADSRGFFEKLVKLQQKYGGAARLPELSMGMTLDLEYAIEAGATLVRIGTAIFGERPPREAPL